MNPVKYLQGCLLLALLFCLASCGNGEGESESSPRPGISGELRLVPLDPDMPPSLEIFDGESGALLFAMNTETADAMASQEISTYYPFLDNEFVFFGIPLTALLSALGRQDFSYLALEAADGYRVELPAEDLQSYGHMLTHRMDGRRFAEYDPPMDRGPFALVIDLGNMSEDAYTLIRYQMIWFLTRIEVYQ